MGIFTINNSASVQIQRVYSGSTIMQGFIVSQRAKQSTITKAKEKLEFSKSLSGINILQSSISSSPIEYLAVKQSESSNKVLIIIIATVVPSVAVTLDVALVIYYCRKMQPHQMHKRMITLMWEIIFVIFNCLRLLIV